jgi:methylmalonyl-CoA/ethylmalonyl-CoA epimerase
VQWELIQPLDDESIYARFLAEKGEGVHHVGVGVPSYEGTIAALAEKGHHVVLGGEYNGVTFAYLSTDRDPGVITEIFDAPPGLEQKPDAVYPP